MIRSEVVPIFGLSDDGAHTKFFTGGRSTETSNSLATIPWSLSKKRIGGSGRILLCAQTSAIAELVQGAAADIVVYDLERLKVMPMEIAHDFPGGEWRRVQRAEGYRAVVLNARLLSGTGAKPVRSPGACCATVRRRTAVQMSDRLNRCKVSNV